MHQNAGEYLCYTVSYNELEMPSSFLFNKQGTLAS
jgi:hypothetical protein